MSAPFVMQDALDTVDETAARLRMSKRTYWRRAAEGILPKPIKTGGKCACVWRSEVDRYLADITRKQKRKQGEDTK